MSEPKIIDVVTPQVWTEASYPLFGSPLIRDGLVTPVAQSTGGGLDGQYVYGEFGDNVTPVDFTGVLFLNHNRADVNPFYGIPDWFSLNRQGSSISGVKTYEITEPITNRRHTMMKFPKMNSYRLAVGFTNTNPTDQLKSLGELILFNENTITLARDFTSYEERWREVAKEISLSNGGIHRVVTTSSAGKNLRYEAVAKFNFMTESEVESWKALKESGNTFLFMPESETAPQNIYRCHFTGPWNVKSTSNYKGAGYTISVTLKEVK